MFGLNDDALAKRIGKLLAAQRKRMGFTQERVAELIGVEPLTVSRQETGWSVPSVLSLIKLANLYQVDVSVLVGQDVYDTQANQKPSLRDLEQKFIALDQSDKEMLLKMFDKLMTRLLEG